MSTTPDPAQLTALDSILWGRAEQGNVSPLRSLITIANRTGQAHLTAETVIVDEDRSLIDLVPTELRPEIQRFGVGELGLINDEQGRFVIGMYPTAYDGVFHLAGSIPTTDPRWQKVERWIGRGAPRFAACFLNHADFAEIGIALSSLGDVEVSRLTARRHSDLSSLTRGWQERDSALRPSPIEAINSTEREGASVRSLTIKVKNGMSIHLRRLAGATYYSGDFRHFDEIVLSRLAKFAAARRELLRNRQRRINEPPRQPIVVRLQTAAFKDAEATGSVLSTLQDQRETAIAVLHRNPYLHVVVTDYLDGSNFDVFVTSADEIRIFPGFRSSIGALARLTQQLGDHFAAKEIVEANVAPKPTLAELCAE